MPGPVCALNWRTVLSVFTLYLIFVSFSSIKRFNCEHANSGYVIHVHLDDK